MWHNKSESKWWDEMDDSIDLDIPITEEVCVLCSKPNMDEMNSVSINNQIICDLCISYAMQCTVCMDVFYEEELQDGTCINCRKEIGDESY